MTLLVTLATMVTLPWVAVGQDWTDTNGAHAMICNLVGPAIGLVGAATGFYFGEKSIP